jgi:hypothetical protein
MLVSLFLWPTYTPSPSGMGLTGVGRLSPLPPGEGQGEGSLTLSRLGTALTPALSHGERGQPRVRAADRIVIARPTPISWEGQGEEIIVVALAFYSTSGHSWAYGFMSSVAWDLGGNPKGGQANRDHRLGARQEGQPRCEFSASENSADENYHAEGVSASSTPRLRSGGSESATRRDLHSVIRSSGCYAELAWTSRLPGYRHDKGLRNLSGRTMSRTHRRSLMRLLTSTAPAKMRGHR